MLLIFFSQGSSVDFPSKLLVFSSCCEDNRWFFVMDKDSDLLTFTPAPKSGFVSGNETTFNFTDDDVIISDVEFFRSISGW